MSDARTLPAWRSILFVPANVPRFVEKAHTRGADALIIDCTYLDDEYPAKVGWGHSCVSQVVDLAHEAGVLNLYLFHHDPDQSDEDIDRKLETALEGLAQRDSSTLCFAAAERDELVL